MVSSSAGARKWGDCTRVWVETVVTATVKQSNSTAVLLPPPLPSKGKWLPETWTGAFKQCHNSCYFILAFLTKAPKTMNFSAILEFGSSIHLIIVLESEFWMNILKNNCELFGNKTVPVDSYIENLDFISEMCFWTQYKVIPQQWKNFREGQLWAVMWLLSVQLEQLSWALWVAETVQYIDISTH